MKKLSVIILNWNGRELLEKFLPKVVKYTSSPEVEVVVADNGSTDDSIKWINNNFPDLRVLKLDRNYGFAEGYNIAIQKTRREFTLLLNSDVEVTEGWWQPLLAFMESHPEAGACQPKIRSFSNPKLFEYAGAAGGFIDKLGYPYCRGRLFDSLEEDCGQYDGEPIEVAWASGAALMVRTEVYEKLGGLDPDFFAHMEEIDLCCRMINAGYKVYALSDSHVLHVGGGSLAQGNPQKTYLNFRNNLLFLHKNMPEQIGKRRLFVRRLVDTLAIGMYALKFDFRNARAIIKAHRDFRKMRTNYKDFPEKDVMRRLPGADRNIILDHYILRKKK